MLVNVQICQITKFFNSGEGIGSNEDSQMMWEDGKPATPAIIKA
jgi:hypothetical protein